MAATDLAVKLRLLLTDHGVLHKLARVASFIVGLRAEFDWLGAAVLALGARWHRFGVAPHVVRVVTENARTLKFGSHGFERE